MKKIYLLTTAFLMLQGLYAQKSNPPATDTAKKTIDLEELIISVNKWEQKLNEVPNFVLANVSLELCSWL